MAPVAADRGAGGAGQDTDRRVVAHHRPHQLRERTGYPTQKPLGVLRRIVAASSRADDLVIDWCAGSGTTGVAAVELGRRFLALRLAALTRWR